MLINGRKYFLSCILMLVVFLAIFLLLNNISQPIVEMHGFRQTQTALTSYWLTYNGFSTAYETPVVGYPWSIPFEFPIYQYVVSLSSSLFDISLDATGRAVSILFFLLTIAICRLIFSHLNLPKEDSTVLSILLLTSPIYLFWSRTFMIESAALFLTSVAILFYVKLLTNPFKWSTILAFSIFLSLALLQKVTTSLPIVLLISILSSYFFLKNFSLQRHFIIRQFYLFIFLLLPVLIAMTWTLHTDQIKSQNTIGLHLTSSALQKWNFGTFEARTNINNWILIVWDRSFKQNLAGLMGIIFITWGGFTLKGHQRNLFYIFLFLYILNIAIFFNLHKVHNYYQYSSIIYLYCSVALVIADIYRRNFSLGSISIAAFIFFNLLSYTENYYPSASKKIEENQNSTLLTAKLIKQNTLPHTAAIIYGADWSSEIAYYSERKSLTVPKWNDLYKNAWKNPAVMTGKYAIGAIAFCNFKDKDSLQSIMSHPYVFSRPTLYRSGNCFLWFSDPAEIKLDGQLQKPIEINSVKIDKNKFKSVIFSECDNSVDVIDGKRAAKETNNSISGLVGIKGWAIQNDQIISTENPYLVLIGEKGDLISVEAYRVARKDVAAHFKNENLINSGIEGYLDTQHLENKTYSLYLALEKQQILSICTSSKKPISVEN